VLQQRRHHVPVGHNPSTGGSLGRSSACLSTVGPPTEGGHQQHSEQSSTSHDIPPGLFAVPREKPTRLLFYMDTRKPRASGDTRTGKKVAWPSGQATIDGRYRHCGRWSCDLVS
jgi:hypothetical protein